MSLIPLSHVTAALLIHKQEVNRSFFFFFYLFNDSLNKEQFSFLFSCLSLFDQMFNSDI